MYNTDSKQGAKSMEKTKLCKRCLQMVIKQIKKYISKFDNRNVKAAKKKRKTKLVKRQ